MGKKYRFRQVFIICQDKQIINSTQNKTVVYESRSDAEEQCENTIAEYRPYEMSNPFFRRPKFEVEGSYLVHESLYDELLKNVAKVSLKVVK